MLWFLGIVVAWFLLWKFYQFNKRQTEDITFLKSQLNHIIQRLLSLEKASPFPAQEAPNVEKVSEKSMLEPSSGAMFATGSTAEEKENTLQTVNPWEEHSQERKAVLNIETSEVSLWKMFKETFIGRLLLGGNILVRAGIIILFFGIGFLLKYASNYMYFSIELRLLGVAITSFVLLGIGWHLRNKRPGYALTLQGGGVGALYLLVFVAMRVYSILPISTAFIMLVIISIFSATLAILQNTRVLAITGITGGFLAPILASTGTGSHIVLFSYYAILNLGIASIAWQKAWRELNTVGFLFTFVLGLSWGLQYYRPVYFSTVEPFLIFFFLLYISIAISFSIQRVRQFIDYIDRTLVLGVPIATFCLQAGLIHHIKYGLAYSALAMSATYIAIALGLNKFFREKQHLLVELFAGMGIILATLAIPLALSAEWTSALWAIEGLGFIWIGCRQRQVGVRFFGMLLELGAGIAFFYKSNQSVDFSFPLSSGFYFGGILIGIAGLVSAWLLSRDFAGKQEEESLASSFFMWWGVIWWMWAGWHILESHTNIEGRLQQHLFLLFFAVSCGLWTFCSFKSRWKALQKPGNYVLLPVMLLITLSYFGFFATLHFNPFVSFGYLAWPVAFTIYFGQLYFAEKQSLLQRPWQHLLSFWLLIFLLMQVCYWYVNAMSQLSLVWVNTAWILPTVVILGYIHSASALMHWPVRTHRALYQENGSLPLIVLLAIWCVQMNIFKDGNMAPLSYIPFLNPLDLMQIAILFVFTRWLANLSDITKEGYVISRGAFGLITFVWLNAVLLRTLHQFFDVPFNFAAMMDSLLVQASLSLFWGLLALTMMIVGTQRQYRVLWMSGLGFLILVIIKLFLIDLLNVGSIERIISFLSIGILMLVIGYFSPIPPPEKIESKKT